MEECSLHLEKVDAVMVGRAAYQNPWILSEVDEKIYEEAAKDFARESIVDEFSNYVSEQLMQGERLSSLTKHILGLYHGKPGARSWRRILTTESILSGAGLETIETAKKMVERTVAFNDQSLPLQQVA